MLPQFAALEGGGADKHRVRTKRPRHPSRIATWSRGDAARRVTRPVRVFQQEVRHGRIGFGQEETAADAVFGEARKAAA